MDTALKNKHLKRSEWREEAVVETEKELVGRRNI